jgi:acetyl esterase/lipase
MCDFSQYNGPSAEWLALEATLPPMSIDINTDPGVFQKASNTLRESISAKAMEILAPKVHTTTYTIPTRDGSTIRVRSYCSVAHSADETLPVYLYFHGGGFITGTLDSEDAACAAVAINVKVLVLNIEYRHTPEYTFPTAWEDSQDAFVWLHKNASALNIDADKVVVGGVSAGGQLAASLALEKHLGKSEVLAGLPKIAGQVLMIPCVAHPSTYSTVLDKLSSPSVSSYVSNEHAPLLPVKVVHLFTHHLHPPLPVSPTDTKLNPINATVEQVKGLAPAVFGIAGLDPLRDEGLLYAKLLSEAGVQTRVRVFKGVPHGARRFGEQLPESSREWDRCVVEGLEWCLASEEQRGKAGFEVDMVCG